MADSLCTYMASGQRSHKGMCPGLAEQYYLMPDTKTFIGCPCTTFLPVPPCYILSEFYQSYFEPTSQFGHVMIYL